MRKDLMTKKLQAAFSPLHLEVIDESHFHAGHAGAREGGETHYRVKITAAAFKGKNRLTMHRMVNDVLADDLSSGVHALAIEALAG